MTQAIWNGTILAESNDCVVIEGNHYFPPDAINHEYFIKSDKQTVCPWKGTASYYDITVNGETNYAAAWYYPDPKPKAAAIKNHIAFWQGVLVS